MKKRRHVVEEGAQGPLGKLVARVLEEAEAQSGARILAGSVSVDGRRVRDPARMVGPGATLLVVLEESGQDVLEALPPPSPLHVLYEDDVLLAVDKPAGITAQPTPGRAGDSLLDLASQRMGREVGLVHRLDRETSGVTVFGLTRKATSALAAAFREGGARKRYLAACGPRLADAGERGTIDLPLSRDPSRPGRFRATRAAHGVDARTLWVRLAAMEDHALVALFPLTGRTHQLRAHLAALHAPIGGDLRYGGQRLVAGEPAGRCLLHAQGLLLRHPTRGSPLLLESPVPTDLARVFRADGVTPPSGPWTLPEVGGPNV